MAHIWFMHDAHLGYALFFLDMLAEYTLLSMTVMVTPCLWYVVGMKLVCPMSKFLKPLLHAPLLANPDDFQHSTGNSSGSNTCTIWADDQDRRGNNARGLDGLESMPLAPPGLQSRFQKSQVGEERTWLFLNHAFA